MDCSTMRAATCTAVTRLRLGANSTYRSPGLIRHAEAIMSAMATGIGSEVWMATTAS